MHDTSIFTTYNPASELEQTLAIRLHTIGAVSGYRMSLPDRYNGAGTLDNETRLRIANSKWFIVFSIGKLSKIVLEEIKYAISLGHDPATIIIIYQSATGRIIVELKSFTEIWFDLRTETADQVVHRIMQKVWQIGEHVTQPQHVHDERIGLAALVTVGVGLFVLSLLSREEDERTVARSRVRHV